MAENKFVFKTISTYTGKENVLHQKEFETREQAEKYRDITESIVRETQTKNPALPYTKFVVEEL